MLMEVEQQGNASFEIQGQGNNVRATFAPNETVIRNTLTGTGLIQGLTIASTKNVWVQMSPSNNALHFKATDGQCRVRRINNVVEVQWDLIPTAQAIAGLQTTTAVAVFTLPVGFRPSHWIRTTRSATGTGASAVGATYNAIINSTGTVQFNSATFVPVAGNGQGTGTRFTDQETFTLF